MVLTYRGDSSVQKSSAHINIMTMSPLLTFEQGAFVVESKTIKRTPGPTNQPKGLVTQVICASSSVGRASASQAEGREFEPPFTLT